MCSSLRTSPPQSLLALLELLDGPLVESTNDLAFLLVDVDEVGVIFAPTSRRGLNVEQGVLLAGRRADPDEPDEVTLSEIAASKRRPRRRRSVRIAGSLSQQQGEASISTGEEPTSLDGPQLSCGSSGSSATASTSTPSAKARRSRHHSCVLGASTARTSASAHAATWFASSTSPCPRSVHRRRRRGLRRRAPPEHQRRARREHRRRLDLGDHRRSRGDGTGRRRRRPAVDRLGDGATSTPRGARHRRLARPWHDRRRAPNPSRRLRPAGVRRGRAAGTRCSRVALSPLFPVGTARQVDPDPGLHADAVTLLAGTVALIAGPRTHCRGRSRLGWCRQDQRFEPGVAARAAARRPCRARDFDQHQAPACALHSALRLAPRHPFAPRSSAHSSASSDSSPWPSSARACIGWWMSRPVGARRGMWRSTPARSPPTTAIRSPSRRTRP